MAGSKSYCSYIKPSYVAHVVSPNYVDDAVPTEFQYGTYLKAQQLAIGCSVIIDIGSSHGWFHYLFEGKHIIGVDRYECKTLHEFIQRDFEMPGQLEFKTGIKNAVVICADVIEHLNHYGYLMEELQRLLSQVYAVIISTPDRAYWRGPDDNGPPPTEWHAREWNMPEWIRFISQLDASRYEFFRSQSMLSRPEVLGTLTAVLYG